MQTLKRIWAFRKEPLVADHSLDIMCMLMWLIYGLWGILSTVQHVTILNAGFQWYPILWGAVIGIGSWIAFLGAFMLFVVKPDDLDARIFWKRLETYAVTALVGFVFVYPSLQLYNLVDGEGVARYDMAVLSWSYLLVPLWRIGHLRARIFGLQLMRAQRDG